MNLTPYVDNEKISILLRAKRSGDEQWIEDAARLAREEPRLERVVDAILAATIPPGSAVPDAVATPPPPLETGDTGTKGGEARPVENRSPEKGGRDR